MVTVTEKEWKHIPDSRKHTTPLTRRRQMLWNNPANPHVEEIWLTEGIDFIVSDKEGGRYADNTNN